MRLINTKPREAVGQTIIRHGDYWQVVSATDDELHLKRSWSEEAMTISAEQFRQCRLYPSRQEVAARYPRLLRALRWSCILSHGEAEGAVHGIITVGPHWGGSEAVANVGGAQKAIGHALRCRHAVRQEANRAKAHLN